MQSIDTTLSKYIDSLLEIDQKYSRNVNDGFVLYKPVYWFFGGMNNRRLYRQLRTLVFQYALLVDFMYPDTKKYPEYEYWSTRIFSATTVNQNRISVGLNSLEQEKRNYSIEINRRKSKTAHSEIVLE